MKKKNNSKNIQVESLQIGLASPDCIRKWSERLLPNGKIVGQVTSSQTVNYKTLKPEKGGLFCERIFGPIKDFECSCGKKKNDPQQKFCPECLVEYTSSRVRRYRLGYIQLVSPVTHIWYLKGTPSYISTFLDIRKKKVEAITYCTEIINKVENSISSEEKLFAMQSKPYKNYFKFSPFSLFNIINKFSEKKFSLKLISPSNNNEFMQNKAFTDPFSLCIMLYPEQNPIPFRGNGDKSIKQKGSKNSPFPYAKQTIPFKGNGEESRRDKEKDATAKENENYFLLCTKKSKRSKNNENQLKKITSNTNEKLSYLLAPLLSLDPKVKEGNSKKLSFKPNKTKINFEAISKKNLFFDDSHKKERLLSSSFPSLSSSYPEKDGKARKEEKKILQLNSTAEITKDFTFGTQVAVSSKESPVLYAEQNPFPLKGNGEGHKSFNQRLTQTFKEKVIKTFHQRLIKTFSFCFYSKSKGQKLIKTFNRRLMKIFNQRLERKDKRDESLNNYYTVSQDCSWELQDDWNKFLYYMRAYPEQTDIQIPLYKNRIDNQKKSFSLNFTQPNAPRTGAEAIKFFLSNINLRLLEKQIRIELSEINEEIDGFENQGYLFFSEQRRLQFLLDIRAKKCRRLKLVRHFRRSKTRPEWMILSTIPVLPPDLRPIIQLDGDQVAVSDLNKLYQKIIFRNNRMKRHRKTNWSIKSDEMKYAQRLLQEAVDALIENGKGGTDPICGSNDRPLKSLSDMLKGKKGRFRQNLLGKRVDYSGRSVIVVGPKLQMHECGLPKEMAVELFQPFLIRQLMTKKIVRTIVGAKAVIKSQDPIIWEILQKILQNHPVLLNRAPTLHRLGIQAFQPKLVDGRAILLHPLVCTAFNADFDGDQMAVHVPLSFQARAEAWKLMWSRNNLLSPATGQPILVPSQDMILGCYYLTTNNLKPQLGKGSYFIDLHDVIQAFNQKKIYLHAPIWVQWSNFLENNMEFEQPLEIHIHSNGRSNSISSSFQKLLDKNQNKISQFIRTTPGRVLFNQKIMESLACF